MNKLFTILSVVTILFIIYTEWSVGGILIRNNSSGEKSINFSSMFHFMIHPLYNKFLWNIRSLDINYPFIILVTVLLYKFENMIKYFV